MGGGVGAGRFRNPKDPWLQERVGGRGQGLDEKGGGLGLGWWVGSPRPLGPRLGLRGGSKSFGAGKIGGRGKFRNLRF